MREIWKDIKGYEGEYCITNKGAVWSRPKKNKRGYGATHTGKFLKQYSYKGHYVVVHIGKKKRYVHRLVLEAFVLNPDGKKYCNHKDGDKLNNVVSNLEWCTQKENCIHAYKIGLTKPSKAMRINCSKIGKRSRGFSMEQAGMIRRLAMEYTVYKIARLVGSSDSVISNIVYNRTYREE